MARRHTVEQPVYDPDWARLMMAVDTPTPLVYQPPVEPFLSVLYEDAHLLVLDKPALLLTTPGKPIDHGDCLESRAQAQYPDARIAHRLDRPTSGVVVMPRGPVAHRHIGLQFEKRYTQKQYIARVSGILQQENGVIEAPICGDWPNRPRQMVHFEHGKSAQTHWQVLEYETEATRVVLRPITGRTHQLRVHMAWIGHPILGDEFYAPPLARAAANRLQLHAKSLSLRHPNTGEAMTFSASCPF